MMLFSKVIIPFDCDTTSLFKLCICPAKRVLLIFFFWNSLFTSWSNWIFSFCKPILSFFLCFLLSVTLLKFERSKLRLPNFERCIFVLNVLNIVLRMLPVTIHLKTLETGFHALCYVCYELTSLLRAFAWPLHLPNIDFNTKLSKNSEYK